MSQTIKKICKQQLFFDLELFFCKFQKCFEKFGDNHGIDSIFDRNIYRCRNDDFPNIQHPRTHLFVVMPKICFIKAIFCTPDYTRVKSDIWWHQEHFFLCLNFIWQVATIYTQKEIVIKFANSSNLLCYSKQHGFFVLKKKSWVY